MKLFQHVAHSQSGWPVMVRVRVEDGKTLLFAPGSPQPIILAEGQAIDISVTAVGNVSVPLKLDVDRLQPS